MANVVHHLLEEQLALADVLLERRSHMFSPQDLPGRYGRVVMAVDHLLEVVDCEAVLAGGWAVWHHGYIGRVTQDLDIVIAAESVDSLIRAALVSGFEILASKPGRWPKLIHKDTGIQLDILPEGARPGVASKLAPTTIPHPAKMGGSGRILNYISLPSLIELKLAAGRARDEADVVELIRVNPEHLDSVREHLAGVHSSYVKHFNQLVERAREQGEE
jgi:hypothetical protein